MDDDADRFVPLCAPQTLSDPQRELAVSREADFDLRGGPPVEGYDGLGEIGNGKGRRAPQRVECHREAWCGIDEPREAAEDIDRGTTERAMFELQVDRVEIGDLAANLLDMPVAQRPHARVLAAQQVLVEIEDADVEYIGELAFERLGVGGDAAQLIAGRDNREALASRRQYGDIARQFGA